METAQEKLILSEEQGKEILYAATKMAVDKFTNHTLISEADFFSGTMFVLQELSESPEDKLVQYLAGPAFGLMFGKSLIGEHFDQSYRAEVDKFFQQNGAMAHYRSRLRNGLNDIVNLCDKMCPDADIAVEIAESLLEDVFGEYRYADDE